MHLKVWLSVACEVFSLHMFTSSFFLSATVQNVKGPQEIQHVHRMEERSYMNSSEKYAILKYLNRAIGFKSANDRCGYRLQERKQNKINEEWIKIQKKKRIVLHSSNPDLLHGPFQCLTFLSVK